MVNGCGKSLTRGAFIVLEGCDRSGKSTQSKILVNLLEHMGINVKHIVFPARQSHIGQVINAYLTNKQDLTDECIHLLFSVNRWEFKNEMKQLLEAGTTLVVDRYTYSGVAYSVAKGFDYDWCMGPERGLLRPDIVFYLKATPESLAERGNYGEERYEKLDFQNKVSKVFNEICVKEGGDYWHVVNAMKTKEEISEEITQKTLETLKTVATLPLNVL